MRNLKVLQNFRLTFLTCVMMVFSISSIFAQVPGLAWTKNIGGSDAEVVGSSVVTDLSGNVYTTGYFNGTADFDPGTGVFEMTADGGDGFVSKVDATGNFVWAVQFGAGDFDAGNSITIDAAGNILVGGYFVGTVDFDPAAANVELTAFGSTDGVILKLAPNGNFIFAKQVGGIDEDFVQAIRTDASNNIYITGGFTGDADFDPGVTDFELTSNGLLDVFVTKLNVSGDFGWAVRFGGDGEDYDFGKVLAIASGGDVYVGGEYGDGDSGDYRIFINKLDNTGSLIWDYVIGGTNYNTVNSLTLDAAGDVYFSGLIHGTVDFDPLGTGFDLIGLTNYVCKLNPSAGLVWVVDLGSGIDAYSMALDITGNIFITGSYGETVDVDPGTGIANLFTLITTEGDNGLFILKLDDAGNYVWAQGFNGIESQEDGRFVTTDNIGNIYVLGQLSGSINFATGVCSPGHLTSVGQDLFMLKLNPTSVQATCFGVIEQPVSGIACEGDAKLLSALSGGTSRITYQWQKNNGSIFVDISDQEVDGDGYEGYEGTDTPFLFVTPINSSGTGDFRCRVSGENVSDVFSNTITLTYSGSTSIPHVVANSSCGPGQVMITAYGGTEGNYAWYEEGVLIEGQSASTYTTPLLSTPTEFSVSKSTNGCVSIPVDVEVNINACAPVPGLVWVAQPQLNSAGSIRIGKMVKDATGNLYAVGYFNGTVDFDSGPGTAILSTAIPADRENFLLKLTSDGAVVWVKSLGDIASTIYLSVDGTANIYLTGGFRGTVDFDPGTATVSMTATGNPDMFITKFDTDGNFSWAKRIGGSGSSRVSAASIDSDANGVYTTGSFTGSVDFDPNTGVLTRTSAGSTLFSDIFICKLNPSGDIASGAGWAHRIGASSATDGGRAIKVDGAGNVYSTGTFFGTTTDFDPGAGTAILIGGGATDLYIHKLNNAGVFQWAKNIGGAGVELPYALAVDATGNPHILGTFGTIIPNQTVDFDPGAGTVDLVSNQGIVFILKLTTAGAYTWAKNFGGTFGSELTDITVDALGNVLITGANEGNYDYDPGPAIYQLKSNTNRDVFISQLDINGNFSWAFNLGSTGLSYFNNGGHSIVTDPDGSIYTAGIFNHASDFDPGHCTFPLYASNGESFIQKIRPGIAAMCFNIQPLTTAGCIGTPATLSVDATGTTNITYQWQKLNTTTSLFENLTNTGGYSGTTSTELVIDTNGNFGAGTYQCKITGDNAPDKVSSQASLTVNVIPSVPMVTGSTACSDLSQVLTATGSADGNYRWYDVEVDGEPIAGETNGTYTTPQLTAATTYYAAINNGFCESARVAVTAEISDPLAPTVTPSSICGPGAVTLVANGAANGEYRWHDAETGGNTFSGEVNSSFTTPSLVNTTSYYVSINNGSCESSRTEVIATVNALPASPNVTNASVCLNATAILSASGSTDGNYRWYTSSSGGAAIAGEVNHLFTTPTLSTTTSFFVSIVSGGCESARVEVTAMITNCSNNTAPVIDTAPLETNTESVVTLNLLSLISDADDNLDVSTLEITVQPQSGATASIDVNGNLILDYANTNFAGTDQLTIKVCDLAASCTEQILFIEVIGSVLVYNAISPNGDGLNETLQLQYIDLLPTTTKNKVTIYNRWGDEVFSISDYDNTARVFSGMNNNGNVLPTGTYFYKIEFTSNAKPITGYLYLKR